MFLNWWRLPLCRWFRAECTPGILKPFSNGRRATTNMIPWSGSGNYIHSNSVEVHFYVSIVMIIIVIIIIVTTLLVLSFYHILSLSIIISYVHYFQYTSVKQISELTKCPSSQTGEAILGRILCRVCGFDFLWEGDFFVQQKQTNLQTLPQKSFLNIIFFTKPFAKYGTFLNLTSSEPFFTPNVIYFSWPAVVLNRRTPWQPEVSEPKRTCALEKREGDGSIVISQGSWENTVCYVPFSSSGICWNPVCPGTKWYYSNNLVTTTNSWNSMFRIESIASTISYYIILVSSCTSRIWYIVLYLFYTTKMYSVWMTLFVVSDK